MGQISSRTSFEPAANQFRTR